MKKEKKIITEKGNYTFGDNYELIFKDDEDNWLKKCNITCGNDCEIECRHDCNITCGNRCDITCGDDCNITCGSYCNITCGNNSVIHFGSICYIKGGERSKLKLYENLLKTISKDEEFIWWYINYYGILINTFEDVGWRNKYPDKWNELYPFVQNELNSATLF